MLRIVRSAEANAVVFSLSGRVELQHATDLEAAIESESCPVVVDLEETRLIDREVVPILTQWKQRGVTLRNCPGYILSWIACEGG